MSARVERLRRDFPALQARGRRKPPHYLDSACMSLVPQPVLSAMEEYYREFPGCAGRSLHRFAEEVGHRVEATRELLARFLGAGGPASVVFTRNATEAINAVCEGLDWHRGDRVLVTDQEHNSNLVPWQRLARERGVALETLPLPDSGGFDADALEERLARGVRLVSFFATSNLDGRTLPIREIAERVHDRGGELLVDGCQAVPHRAAEVERSGADYYALSLHKMLGPTGMGLLTGRPEALDRLRPLLLGGETVEWTTLTDHALRPVPHRLEPGLQNYAGIVGAGAATRYLGKVGYTLIERETLRLNERVTRALEGEPRVRILGPAEPRERPSILAFTLDGIDPHAAALFLDEGYSVLVRSGMQCVHSWYRARGLEGNVRASFYFYNSTADADALVEGVRELLERVPGPTGTSAPAAAPRSGRGAPSPARAAGS